ncbi:MAG TPA: hypothetical protein VFD73_19285, partial [Gemmatimonadales bacterium]|nr:hypothetical protein [Gemmatimonadales bacterium]
MTLAPGNSELRDFLDRVAPEWNRTPRTRVRPATLQVVARTRRREFQIFTAGGWRDFYVRGVNLGVALPGRYASEFPADSARYAGWLDTLSAMHANTLRIYTILDPAFYRALRGWNLAHPNRALWLIHGVWAELPPKQNFRDSQWNADLRKELARVVDVIHGAASIPPRPGHASGHFDADVSSWVLAYIVGREWEPFAVKSFDATNPVSSFSGRYLRTIDAPAMDVWLTQQCDFMLEHEAQTYNALRPIAYTNWPTLDPLRHPTEATTAEEAAWRKRTGRRSVGTKLEYENDAVSLDANLVSTTDLNPAGWFASYHAYPYYPDFVFLDPQYQAA